MSETARLRAALHDRLVATLRADFEREGEAVIEALRGKDPAAYVRAIVAILPDAKPQPTSMDELSDDELSVVLSAVRQARSIGAETGGGEEPPVRGERVVALSGISKTKRVP